MPKNDLNEQNPRPVFAGDVSIRDAMLLYTSPKDYAEWPDHPTFGQATVVRWPERTIDFRWGTSLGACFAVWRDMLTKDQKFQLLIDAWHAVVFSGVSPKTLHDALLRIPEYRDMLADDCLPARFRSERDGQ